MNKEDIFLWNALWSKVWGRRMNWEKQLVKQGRREKRKVEGTRIWRKTCGCWVRVSMCEHRHMPQHGSCIEMEGQPLGVGPCLSTLIETCPLVTAEASLAGSGLLGCSSLPFHLPLGRRWDWRHSCTRLFRDVWGRKLRSPNLCNKCQPASHLPKFEHLKSQISQGSSRWCKRT